MLITKATQNDAIQLTALINKAYEHENRWKTSLRTSESEIRELLKQENILFFKGLAGLELLVCAALETKEENATFGMLSVWPDLHGQGLGYQMICFLEDHARAQKYKAMCCEVASFNTHLRHYYQKLGYQWFGSKPWDNPFLKTKNVTFELYRKLL